MKSRVGIAFGGGGARGYAHIGVLRALRNKATVLPEIAAGTSVGSIFATCYAADIPQKVLEKQAEEFGWFQHVISLADTTKRVLRLRSEGGLLSNATLGETVNTMVEGRGFDDLPVDLAVAAVDIDKRVRVIITSKRAAERIDMDPLYRYLTPPANGLNGFKTEIITDVESIGLAVRASCAVPGVFQPVEIGDYLLVDGGVVDQVPVDAVLALGAEKAIAVSLGMALVVDQVNSAFSTMSKIIESLAIPQIRKSMDLADLAFQITEIERRSPIKLHQMGLIDQGEMDMLRSMEKVDWL
jgi:NTE family protein